MKKIIYFLLFLVTGFICLFDSFIVINKIGIATPIGLGMVCSGIGNLFILLWLEFKEMSLAIGILLWIIPITNTFEMSKEGESMEEIFFFLFSRFCLGILFFQSVKQSITIAKEEYKKNR